MLTFEIRLLNGEGHTAMIHVTACDTVDEARERLAGIVGVHYVRYEIWQGGHKVLEGPADIA
ncbi:MAG TPA: hypothetical protein VIM56_08200 [Rhizomicrobium sp.]